MFHVMIVGEGDSGKTTFLGLLYATQVKSGSEKTGAFRFHAVPESLDAVGRVFQALQSGSFPDLATKQGISEFTFQLSSRRAGLGILTLRRGPGGPASSTVRLAILRSPVEQFSRHLLGGSVIDQAASSVYATDAFAILVDSTKLDSRGGRSELGPMTKHDAGLESILTIVQRLGEPRGRKSLHPMFVFTKFDRASPDGLRASGVSATPPPMNEVRARAAYAERLLKDNLPTTFALVKARPEEGRRFEPPAFFFSWVRTEGPGTGRAERIRLRRSDTTGWEPDYSADEYRALMAYLADLAMRYED